MALNVTPFMRRIKDFFKLETHFTLGSVGSEDTVIAVGDFTVDTDSGYSPGSLGVDTTNGLLFVSDATGTWKQVTVSV